MNLEQSKEAILTMAGKALANTLSYEDVTQFVLSFRVGLFDAPAIKPMSTASYKEHPEYNAPHYREIRTSSSSSFGGFKSLKSRQSHFDERPELLDLQVRLANDDLETMKSYFTEQAHLQPPTHYARRIVSCSCGDVGQDSCGECGEGFNTLFEIQGEEVVSKRKVMKQKWV